MVGATLVSSIPDLVERIATYASENLSLRSAIPNYYLAEETATGWKTVHSFPPVLSSVGANTALSRP